ncbi:GNAT family N-acetyltransferase [Lacinutrix sp. Bg11-31]|uniref:GNAT family N-acetyltransferase n=1 Tax=Lacinutrix sp. Bg11-31 TaxID=2057808 RepID=UPI000C3180D2|nr:GNAT family N-acetyltransferase [Lacinutrix sp. Bg11-31]AUC82686.1 RimJ/RimL family protein N-acetyltransferase [Lacinutrix sp. Bg11-31]
MIVAETNRLIISEFTIKDAPFFMELVNTPNWLKYIGERNIKTIKQAEERITNSHLNSYKNHGFGFYVLRLKESLKPVGTCGLIKRDTLENIDLGFAMLPEYEGLGFGFESSQAIIKLAKEKFKIEKIVAIALEINKNSIKLLEKLGFHFEKKVKPFEDNEELLLFAKKL